MKNTGIALLVVIFLVALFAWQSSGAVVNLLQNPWFRRGTVPETDHWVWNANLIRVAHPAIPSPDNTQGTAIRFWRDPYVPYDYSEIFQIVKADITKPVLEFAAYYKVTEADKDFRVIIYGDNYPYHVSTWKEVWTPLENPPITSGWQYVELKTILDQTYDHYMVKFVGVVSPEVAGGAEFTGVYFNVTGETLYIPTVIK